MKPDKSRQRGSILIVAIMVVMVMLIITIPFLVKLSGQSRSTERAYRALSAFNLAEAGAERALWELNLNFSNPEIVDPEGRIIGVDADGNMIFGPVEEFVGEWRANSRARSWRTCPPSRTPGRLCPRVECLSSPTGRSIEPYGSF
jgi:type II secretory pathway pseudopilin PulG